MSDTSVISDHNIPLKNFIWHRAYVSSLGQTVQVRIKVLQISKNRCLCRQLVARTAHDRKVMGSKPVASMLDGSGVKTIHV